MQPKNVQSVIAVGKNFEYTLFQIAISLAENGLQIWFISPEKFEKPPKDIKTPDKEILQLITFMYLKDYKDLIIHLNGIHLWRKTPNVIILSGFENYCNLSSTDYKPIQAALIMTSLLDSAAVCAVKNNEKVNVLVACAELTEGKEKLQIIKDLYFLNYILKSEDDEFFNSVVQLLK